MLQAASLALLAFGCLAAAFGAWAGNWTAMALIASTIFSTLLCEMGLPFDPSLFLAIDLVVIMWITIGWVDAVAKGGYGRKRDIPILVLFAPIWTLYFVEVDWRSYAIDGLIAIQLLLTFPVLHAWHLLRKVKGKTLDDDHMRRAMA